MAVSNNYKLPIILVTSLFFLWGFAHSMLDILNKHFQEILHITKRESGLIQFVVFIGYFLLALPAGILIKKYGYKFGIITGLVLYAIGAFMFFPAANIKTFEFFLISLFVIASGLTFLETAANPYITVLGRKETSEQRLNLSQSFNGLGWVLGPLVGGLLVFNETKVASNNFKSVQLPYLLIGAVVLIIALLFYLTPLPDIQEEEISKDDGLISEQSLWKRKHFVTGLITLFFYVGTQVGIGSLFINYVTESIHVTNKEASFYLSGAMFLFAGGRFVGTYLMRLISPQKLLTICSMSCLILTAIVMLNFGIFSVYSLIFINFFMSIMFPTIFALSIKDLGSFTKQGSSFLIMSIVGGAIFPFLMGWIGANDTYKSFILPMLGFAVVLYFGFKGYRVVDFKKTPV